MPVDVGKADDAGDGVDDKPGAGVDEETVGVVLEVNRRPGIRNQNFNGECICRY